MDAIKQLFEIFSSLSGMVFVLVGLPLLWRLGILKLLWSKNGSERGATGELARVEKAINDLSGNHLHEVVNGLKRVEDAVNRLDEGNRLNFTNIHNRLNEIAEGMVYLKAKLNGLQK